VKQFCEDHIPMRRQAEPEEVADMALWLCSERANYVNGALGASVSDLFLPVSLMFGLFYAVNIDGGWNAK
jgi:NAD(P)-dependent dehydrogenase (short-subunit alcohol dehydrogenase family)